MKISVEGGINWTCHSAIDTHFIWDWNEADVMVIDAQVGILSGIIIKPEVKFTEEI